MNHDIDEHVRSELMLLVIAIVRQAVKDSRSNIGRHTKLEEKEDAILFLGNCRYLWCEQILLDIGLTRRQIQIITNPNTPWMENKEARRVLVRETKIPKKRNLKNTSTVTIYEDVVGSVAKSAPLKA